MNPDEARAGAALASAPLRRYGDELTASPRRASPVQRPPVPMTDQTTGEPKRFPVRALPCTAPRREGSPS